MAQPGEERRRGPPRDEVLCVDCRHVDIEKSYGRTESSPWGGQLHIPAIHGPRPDRAPRPCIDCGTLVCLACCVKRDFDPWSTTRDMDEETARAIIMSSDPQKEINKRLTPAARCGHATSRVPRPENKKKNRCFTAGSMLSFGDGDADAPPADYKKNCGSGSAGARLLGNHTQKNYKTLSAGSKGSNWSSARRRSASRASRPAPLSGKSAACSSGRRGRGIRR